MKWVCDTRTHYQSALHLVSHFCVAKCLQKHILQSYRRESFQTSRHVGPVQERRSSNQVQPVYDNISSSRATFMYVIAPGSVHVMCTWWHCAVFSTEMSWDPPRTENRVHVSSAPICSGTRRSSSESEPVWLSLLWWSWCVFCSGCVQDVTHVSVHMQQRFSPVLVQLWCCSLSLLDRLILYISLTFICWIKMKD